ncbi:MAG: hypothetical protein ACREQJ_18020 [Candidatus Binatia bacterium]
MTIRGQRGAASGALLKTIAVVLVAIFGWHLYASRVVRREIETRLARDSTDRAGVEVSIQPLTNVVTVKMASPQQAAERKPGDPFSALGAMIGSALGGAVVKAMEPAIERDVNTRARELFDLYAMILGYRVKVVLAEGGERT